jgi:hypothetical protein
MFNQQQEIGWIMRLNTRRIVLTLTPVLLLGACGSLAQRRTARLLNERLQTRMAPDISAGQASVQSTSDGARVTLLNNTLFPNNKSTLDGQYPDIRANIIEGLLAPDLMQIRVTDTSNLPEEQRNMRVNNVRQYLAAYGLGNVLQPPSQTDAGSGPAGLTLTISVVCPQWNAGTSYRDGRSMPVCE